MITSSHRHRQGYWERGLCAKHQPQQFSPASEGQRPAAIPARGNAPGILGASNKG